MSGRDRRHPLPELQRWESAVVDNYVWGNPGPIGTYGKALDTAGGDLDSVADSLAGMDVSGFWTGEAATAFAALRDRVVPAVRGLGAMHRDGAAALGTWQRHLSVYQEDCGTAISTGKQGWELYKTTSCDNAEARTKMDAGKTGISTVMGLRDGSARTCQTALDAATAKADGPAGQPVGPGQPGSPAPSATGPSGTANPPRAPSGQAPVPFTGPIPAGRERPMVDPANGRVVVPVTGVYPAGQPWPYVYADGS